MFDTRVARLRASLPRVAGVVATVEVLWVGIFFLSQLPSRVQEEQLLEPTSYDWTVLWLPIPVWVSVAASLYPLWRGYVHGPAVITGLQKAALMLLVLTHVAVIATTIRSAAIDPVATCISGCSDLLFVLTDIALFAAPVLGSVLVSAGAIATLRSDKDHAHATQPALSGRTGQGPSLSRIAWTVLLSVSGLYFLTGSTLWWLEGAANVLQGGPTYRDDAILLVALALLTPVAASATWILVRQRTRSLYQPWRSAMLCALIVGFVLVVLRAVAGGGL